MIKFEGKNFNIKLQGNQRKIPCWIKRRPITFKSSSIIESRATTKYKESKVYKDNKCQKTEPYSNNNYTVKSLNNMQNTLQRDIDIAWFTKTIGYIHT